MANIKTDKKNVFITKNLNAKLSKFVNYPCTIVTAPTGYGKTTILKHYFNLSNDKVIWISGDSSQELFWYNLISGIEHYNPEIAIRFREIGVPKSEKEITGIVKELKKNPPANLTYLIIDDYYMIESNITNYLFSSLVHQSIINLKMIFITRTIQDCKIENDIIKDKVGFICKDNLKFSKDDIMEYFRINGVLISSEEACQLYTLCNGWPFIIKLYLLNYNNTANSTNSYNQVSAFLKNEIWEKVSKFERYFLIRVCLLNSFTVFQAVCASEYEEEEVLRILKYNEHIDYNFESRTYTINPVYLKYLRKVFGELSGDAKSEIILYTGKIHENNGDFFSAIQCYYAVKNYSYIYSIKATLNDLYVYIKRENKFIFLEIAKNYWTIQKLDNYDFAIILCFILFLYNERQIMQALITYITKNINKDMSILKQHKNLLLSELEYILAFVEYNNFAKMNIHFSKINYNMEQPLSLIAGQLPFTFGIPSILSIYHTESNTLDHEITILEECAPNYDHITNGHGRGFEALFKAEVLYNRGEFEGAEILCHKAIYMADCRNLQSIYISSLFLLARIAIYYGNIDDFNEYVQSITKYSRDYTDDTFMLDKIADISRSFLFATLGEKGNIVDWLKDHNKIEDNTNFIALSFANIIYNKYLLLSEQYHNFLGISGQMLSLTNVFSYIVPRIYTYIYIAIANNEVKEFQKAHKFINEALKLSITDRIYMPFVENYDSIQKLFDETNVDTTTTNFIKIVKKIAKNYTKGLGTIQKVNRDSNNYGLTNRETQIAKLAAQRLSNKEIADTLFIAESTVKSNMKSIFYKLTISSRTDLKKYF